MQTHRPPRLEIKTKARNQERFISQPPGTTPKKQLEESGFRYNTNVSTERQWPLHKGIGAPGVSTTKVSTKTLTMSQFDGKNSSFGKEGALERQLNRSPHNY